MKSLRTQLAVLLLSTLCVLTSAYAQLTPLGDAYTNTADPTTNYGANVLLDVDGATQIAYIQFNLSSIPSGASISQATLKLYVNSVTKAGSFNVDYVNGTWTESTITSNLAPALGSAIVSSVPITTADKNQYILINITPAVVAWLNGSQTNDGIALVANSTFNASFDSKENTTTSHPAELDIVFAGGSSSGITGITTASGSGLIGGGTSGTLNLSLTKACAKSQVLEWNGTVWACATPSGTGTVTSVASGAGLTGGPITSTGTLSVATGGVTNSMLANSSLTVGTASGSGLTGGGSVVLGGTLSLSIASNACASGSALSALPFTCSPFATLATNTFTGSETVDGNTNMIGDTRVDYNGLNKGTTSPAIRFGTGNSGEAISSDRAGTVNVNGIDLYTDFTARLSVTNTGLVGIGTATPAYTLDVRGSGNFNNGVSGESSVVGANGVTGSNSATSGSGTNGVYGSTSSPNGVGVVGVNFSSGGHGVYGQTNGSSTNNPAGVYGTATSSSPSVATYGVYGTSAGNSSGSAGVYGVATATSDSTPIETYGVYGVFPGGLRGAAVAGTTTTISGTGSAYFGAGSGVWGDNYPPYEFYGVLGTSDDGVATLAINSTGSDTSTPALWATNNSTTEKALVFETSSLAEGSCTIDVNGNLVCSGNITSNVAAAQGRRVELYGVASPENWFEDFGSGQLSGGSARIALDPTFASTVNTGETYHVFLTPNGDCKGLYVASKTADGFEVRELGGGASTVSFDYRIVAKRRGYEGVRLEDVTDQMNKMRERQAEMQAKRSNVGPTSAPPRPVAPQITPRVPLQSRPTRVSSLQTPAAPMK